VKENFESKTCRKLVGAYMIHSSKFYFNNISTQNSDVLQALYSVLFLLLANNENYQGSIKWHNFLL